MPQRKKHVYIPGEYHMKLKALAAMEGRTIEDLTAEAVLYYLTQIRKQTDTSEAAQLRLDELPECEPAAQSHLRVR